MSHNIINGTFGPDVLIGTFTHDTINGFTGNDVLIGGAGADIMNGGSGDDFYEVDNVGDVVNDPDLLGLSGGHDKVGSFISYTLGSTIEDLSLLGEANTKGIGNSKNNEVFGNKGNNILFGLAGNDVLAGMSGDDLLDGGSGDDELQGGTGNDQVNGGDGNDLLRGFTGNDQLNGGSGNDLLHEASGNDRLDGGDGIDAASYSSAIAGVIVNLSLASAQNTVGAGVDTILNIENLTGSDYNDTLTGNGANNLLSGLAGDDRLLGGNGNDILNGGIGKDRLDGGTGKDVLSGGDGNDLLNGGAGADTLTGGLGADTFLFRGVSESPAGIGRDVIIGFNGAGAGIGDQISLMELDANVLMAGNQAFSYIGGAVFTAAGQLRYAGGVLQGSTDADTAAEFEIQLVGAPALSVGGLGTDILL
ncbi:MAG TPA: calcium-binding protein [Nitrospira sp.]|nr:calcium-binding protein [Nitrospira sp.]